MATTIAYNQFLLASSPTKEPKEVLAPKKRGRKVGSKNKTTKEPKEVSTPKKRGRPVGSKNKTTKEPKEVLAPKKRGRQSGTKDSHTRKSKKSTHAANTIQARWRIQNTTSIV